VAAARRYPARTLAAKLAPFAPEGVVALLAVAAFVACTAFEPLFLDVGYLFDRSTLYTEVGLMALAMTFVIICGHIDLSCTSILALVGAIVAAVHARWGVPLIPLLCAAPLMGAALGAFNGVLVARLGLPSLVLTLATMALYRGAAQVILGDHSIPVPSWFVGVERITVPGTYVHLPLVVLLSTAVVMALLLHRTVLGRWTFAVGTNPAGARYSGVPVTAVTVSAFTLSGLAAGVAAVLMVSRLGVARYDHARGAELDVITAVVLGGASIFGGRGTILGTMLALALIAIVQTGLGVANVKSEHQTAILGGLLIAAVACSTLFVGRRG
jgi:rhamnose transport system permease protein